MKKPILIAAVTVSLACISCKKDVGSENSDLLGTWSNEDDTEIQINSNGSGYSHYNDGMSYKNINGKVLISGSTITFKAFGVKESYEISARPKTVKGDIVLMLDDEEFFKQ